ncbi:MAG: DNRLRE domain-containing protein [Syntrophomonadales bacterium]|jgi:hypothetical protein
MPINVPATKAVHISQYYGNKNPIPEDRNLYISRFKAAGDNYRSLVSFDLRNMPALLTPGTAVASAYLQLLATRNDIQIGSINASLWRCREDWDHSTVTWNTQPATVEIPDLTFTIPAGWTGMLSVDVTALVKDWLNGVYPNHGFLLQGDELNSGRVVAFSPEASLVIVTSPEGTSSGQVIGDTVFMDYPLRPRPRYGYGNPSHPELNRLLNFGRSTYEMNLEYILGLRFLFREIPERGEDQAAHPRWNNQWISGFDAVTLCSFLVQNNPKRYVEIGSGESTRFARWIIDRLKLRTTIISIDPNPRREIDGLCDRMIRDRVENVDISLFMELQPGDIVFVDSSHRVLMNSDTTAIFLDILPNLRPGVLVHFHDVFLPDDYPPDWIGRYYSEQYLLAAYLLAGSSAIEVLQPNHFICHDPSLSQKLNLLWDDLPHVTSHGASFWIRIRSFKGQMIR